VKGLLSQSICAREEKNGLPSANHEEHSTAELGHRHTFFSLTVNHMAPAVYPFCSCRTSKGHCRKWHHQM